MQKKDKLYKAIMEERPIDKDYERNFSHISFLSARRSKNPKTSLKAQRNSVAVDACSTDSQ